MKIKKIFLLISSTLALTLALCGCDNNGKIEKTDRKQPEELIKKAGDISNLKTVEPNTVIPTTPSIPSTTNKVVIPETGIKNKDSIGNTLPKENTSINQQKDSLPNNTSQVIKSTQ